jgi:hypothetical protein
MYLSALKNAIRKLSISFCAFATLITGSICFGQTFSASIAGAISDPAGARINGAQIHLKNADTNDTVKLYPLARARTNSIICCRVDIR